MSHKNILLQPCHPKSGFNLKQNIIFQQIESLLSKYLNILSLSVSNLSSSSGFPGPVSPGLYNSLFPKLLSYKEDAALEANMCAHP